MADREDLSYKLHIKKYKAEWDQKNKAHNAAYKAEYRNRKRATEMAKIKVFKPL